MSEFETCEGGCTCGKVRYKVGLEPMIVHACHCSWCQRQTGAPLVLNAIYEAEAIEVTEGEVEKSTIPSPSGLGQMMARCPDCKVVIWSHYLGNGMGEHLNFLRVGTLDTPAAMPPDIHIFTSATLPWYVFPEGQTVVEEYYDLDGVWSEESLARIKAVQQAVAS